MKRYYILDFVVENEDYYAKKGNIFPDEIYSYDKGISFSNKELKIKLEKNKGKVRNVIENIFGLPIISETISNTLINCCPTEIELFEVIIGMSTNQKYYFLNILNNIEAMDFENSEYKELVPDTKLLSEIKRLKLNDSKIENRNIFRLTNFRFRIIVSEYLKMNLEKLNLSEIKFIPIEDFVWKLGGF